MAAAQEVSQAHVASGEGALLLHYVLVTPGRTRSRGLTDQISLLSQKASRIRSTIWLALLIPMQTLNLTMLLKVRIHLSGRPMHRNISN